MFNSRNSDSSIMIPRATRNSEISIRIPEVGVPKEPTEEEIQQGEKNLQKMWEYVHIIKHNEFLRSKAIGEKHTIRPEKKNKK
jgi:hypothetical protein